MIAFWTEYNDEQTENTWVTDSGLSVASDDPFWFAGEPNNWDDDENCATIQRKEGTPWQLFDLACAKTRVFVCVSQGG